MWEVAVVRELSLALGVQELLHSKDGMGGAPGR